MEIQKLLIEVKAINDRYLQLAKQTGSSFNIFEVLKIQTSEVRLHSAFIADLLNIYGSHSQGDKYLKLFLEVINISGYDTKQSTIEVEKYTGKINEDKTEGGNIDIILNDKKQVIIIENKIYAPDQKAQLLRYFNYAASNNYEHIHLFYLTLDGKEPSDLCKKELDAQEYRTISYHKDILDWLSNCYTASIALPTIRETINQYIQIIKKLTNQITSSEMNQEVINKIIESKESFESARLIQAAYNDSIKKIKESVKSDINQRLQDSIYTIELKSNNIFKIELHAGEDEGGFYLAFRLVSKTNTEKYGVSSANFVVRQQADNIKKGLYDVLTDKFKKVRNDLNNSNYSLAWYNPKGIGNSNRLENIDTEIFISLLNETKRKTFIDDILQEAREIIEQLQNIFNSN